MAHSVVLHLDLEHVQFLGVVGGHVIQDLVEPPSDRVVTEKIIFFFYELRLHSRRSLQHRSPPDC